MILFLLAVLPPLFIAYYIYKKDKYEKEPYQLIIKSFLFGCFSVLPILILELIIDESLFNSLFTYVFVGIALIEEGGKYFFLKKYLFNKPDFNEPFDGIVYAVMISLGFATIENICYVFGNPGSEFSTAFIRMFTAIPLHAVCGVIMGYYVGMAKFDLENKKSLLIKGIVYAIIIHGLYDYFILAGYPFIFSIIVICLGFIYSKKAIYHHQKNSPFK